MLEDTTTLQFNPQAAAVRIKDVAMVSPLQLNAMASALYEANIFFKREDLQIVRSYKIRGAYNKIVQLSEAEKTAGVVCASAGNHAQGVALSCSRLHVKGEIFMPSTTPKQKIEQVRMFGGEWIEIVLVGDTFDAAYEAARVKSNEVGATFIPPFDDEKIIEGQATVGLEILEQATEPIDYVILPIGGGGLAAGVSQVFKQMSPQTKIIGVEPAGAASMMAAFAAKERVVLDEIDPFVDGAAVKQVGQLTYEICKNHIDQVLTVHEGAICGTILNLYNKDAIVVEPAGAMSVTALRQLKDEIKGKNVVCVLSGSNNDITRMEDMKEKAMLYDGLLHYFIVDFPQRAGALKDFVNEALGDGVDITYFQYTKRNNRESGPVVIGLELPNREEFNPLLARFDKLDFHYEYLNDKPILFSALIG